MSDIKQNFFLKSVGNYCLNKICKHHTKNTEKYASTVAKPATVLQKMQKAWTLWQQSDMHTEKQNFLNNHENTKNALCFTQNFAL